MSNAARAAEHRAKADAADKRVSESIARSDTDGFLSQWAGGLTAQLERRRAEIAEAGDVATFTGLYFGDERVADPPMVRPKPVGLRRIKTSQIR